MPLAHWTPEGRLHMVAEAETIAQLDLQIEDDYHEPAPPRGPDGRDCRPAFEDDGQTSSG